MMTASLLRLAEALADHVLLPGAGRCDLTAFPADPGRSHDHADRCIGRCSGSLAAIRWEDGFVDRVCQRHATEAEERGVTVVYPRRHDGTLSLRIRPGLERGQ